MSHRSSRFLLGSVLLFFSVASFAQVPDTVPSVQTAAQTGTLSGIWENSSRFVEFSKDGRMRIILKPYYGFVYEDTGWLPYVELPSDADTGAGAGISSVDGAAPSASSVHRISVRYSGERSDQLVPLAIIGDGMYFRFFSRMETSPAESPSGASGTGAVTEATLSGFWLSSGNADALRLYRSEETDEFFSYWFSGASYCRIRYWATDARERNVNARFPGPDGATVEIPKFIRIGEVLYTCVTSTGTTLRNYERGSWSLKDGKISFVPTNVAYAGTAAAVREPLSCVLSSDGTVLAFGEPYLVRSKIADLDAEITKHNGLRRPPRKPVFGYMDLDFRWDEIEKIRNNGKAPADTGE